MKTTRCRWKNVLKTVLLLSARAEVCRQDPSASGNADRMFTPTAKQQFIISPAWSLMKLNPTQLVSNPVPPTNTHLSMLLFKFSFSAEQEKTKSFA